MVLETHITRIFDAKMAGRSHTMYVPNLPPFSFWDCELIKVQVKYWALGNETWGPWQVEQMTKEAYAHKALQWAKGKITRLSCEKHSLTAGFSAEITGSQPGAYSLWSRWHRIMGLLHSETVSSASLFSSFN